MTDINLLLERSIPGARSTVRAHIKRGVLIQQAIRRHWGVARPARWKLKHLRWFLTECETWGFSATKRYHYWLTVRAMVAALDKLADWEPHFRGPWRPEGTGGRSPNLPNSARKA